MHTGEEWRKKTTISECRETSLPREAKRTVVQIETQTRDHVSLAGIHFAKGLFIRTLVTRTMRIYTKHSLV